MSLISRGMALWGVIYLLLLLSLITPLGVLTVHFILIPLMVMFVIFDLKRFVAVYAGVLIILVVILRDLGLLLSIVSLFFLVPAAAMGRQYRKGAASGTAVSTGVIAFIAVLLIMLLVSTAQGVNFTEEISDYIHSDPSLMALMKSIFTTDENIDKAIDMMNSMVPMMMITFAVYYSVITHWLGRKLLSKLWKPVPKLKPMKEWMLPKSLVWYYLIVLVLELFVRMDTGAVISVILLNSVPLLTYAFALQGIGFLFFVVDAKGWNRALPIICIVLLPLIAQLLAWVGVLDAAFPLRKRMKSN